EEVPDKVIAEEVRINRIVLYIDDLDRCPSDRVAEVMQAVHLLLAFPLFVVVVGVDARWLSHSLSRRYRGLLRGNGRHAMAGHVDEARATPFDYLEKIFQIPLWLNPLDQVGTVSMVDALLKRSLVTDDGGHGDGAASEPEQIVVDAQMSEPEAPSDAGDGAASTDSGAGDGAAAPAVGVSESGGNPEGATQPATTPASVPAPAESPTEEGAADEAENESSATRHRSAPPLDLSPHSLEIHPNELEFMRTLAPIIGRSPRAVKRFINTYRLIKASLPPARRELFVMERSAESTYQHVMLLLAIVTGLPELSSQFFNELVNDDPNQIRTVGSVVDAIRAPGKSEWRRLDRWISTRSAWRDLPANIPARQASYVARYSFRVSRFGD
ncbi:MAG TPA: P-loop NTPase fold protein, partial [Rhodothermales bacterium]